MRLILLILVALFSGCGDDVRQPLGKTKEFVVLTRGSSTVSPGNEKNGLSGFDEELTHRLADELGLKHRVVVANSDDDILSRLRKGEAHIAAAWQTPSDDPDIRSSVPYFYSHDILVTNGTGQNPGKHSAAPRTAKAIAKTSSIAPRRGAQGTPYREPFLGLSVPRGNQHNDLDLMHGVATMNHDAVLVNDTAFGLGSYLYPELQGVPTEGPPRPIVWLFAPGVDPELIHRANAFLERIERSGELDRLKDRYFGHIDRLAQAETLRFLERMRTILPRYRPLFQAAEASTGIDWRILAALAYQESQWNPLATSPTGVRGMMMLTDETADRLGVRNRLDPEQSIRAGAEYLSDLRDALPRSVSEPDRLWLALAAYNLGMGHLNAGRYIATTLQADPDSWYEMKKVLPLLAQPRYYSRLKSGKGRGGEAVIMVENIRVYTDILYRYEKPYRPFDRFAAPEAKPAQRLEAGEG